MWGHLPDYRWGKVFLHISFVDRIIEEKREDTNLLACKACWKVNEMLQL